MSAAMVHGALSIALDMARVGYYLAPVTLQRDKDGEKRARYHGGEMGPDGKYRGWDEISTRDPDKIRDWYVQYSCSFLVDCGKSGIVGVDLDLKDDRDGIASWQAQNGPQGGIIVDTLSGGQHHYFAADPDRPLVNSADRRTGIDVRGDGGHLYAPGTVILDEDGNPEPGAYTARGPLYTPGDLPPAPELLHQQRKATSPNAGLPREDRTFTLAQAREYCRVKLDALKEAQKGERNHALNTAAFRLGHFVADHFGTSYQAAEKALREHLPEGYGSAPGEKGEIAATIRSGLTDGIEDGVYVRSETETGSAVDEEDPRERLNRLVAAELEKLEVRDEARRQHARNHAPPGGQPASISLAELLEQEDEEEDWRIEGLCPTGGKVLIAAPQKTGKTTLMVNLVRALSDGDHFLAKPTHIKGEWRDVKHAGFPVAALAEGRRVFLLDNEMTPKQLRRWYDRMQLKDPDRVHVQLMRGRSWDIRDPDVRAGWAAHMSKVGTDILVVDPIGPVMHALGIEENNNTEVGGFLAALDALVAEAGISELFVVHHAGHGQERARGASAFQGWPDANWRLVRDDQALTRAFGAEGRDVFERETVLEFDRETGRLWCGEGSRADLSLSVGATVALEAVRAEPGVGQRGLEEWIKNDGRVGGTEKVRAAITRALGDGVVHVHPGKRNGKCYFEDSSCEKCPKVLDGGQ